MARKFVDTSAPVKLYVREPDTTAVQNEIATAAELLISRLTLLGLPSALYGKVREKLLDSSDAALVISSFEAGLSLYQVKPNTEAVLVRARSLLDSHAVTNRLRPPDAIHIATVQRSTSRTRSMHSLPLIPTSEPSVSRADW